VFKKWKFRAGGGDLREIPFVVGVWIFSGTTQYCIKGSILGEIGVHATWKIKSMGFIQAKQPST